MKKIFLTIFFIISNMLVFSQEKPQLEKYYQTKFATMIDGKTEVVLDDMARVDIVTDTFAIEVDFAKKWGESIGQSLYYSIETNKKAGVLLIVNGEKDNRYLNRLMEVANKFDITVWTISVNDDIIKRF